MKSILFYWSKGAEMRVRILFEINKSNNSNKPCYLNLLSKKIGLTHAAVKKHLDLLVEENYVKEINPKGKPVYLELSKKGLEVLNEFNKK